MSTIGFFRPLGQAIFKKLARPVTHVLNSATKPGKVALHQAADEFTRVIPPPTWVYHQKVVPPKKPVTTVLDALKTKTPEGLPFKNGSVSSAPKIKVPEPRASRLMSPSDPVITPLDRMLNPDFGGQPLLNLSVAERRAVYSGLKRSKSESDLSSLKEQVSLAAKSNHQKRSMSPGLSPANPVITPLDRMLNPDFGGQPLLNLSVAERRAVYSGLKRSKSESDLSALKGRTYSSSERSHQQRRSSYPLESQAAEPFFVSTSPFATQLASNKNPNFGPSFPQRPLSEGIELLKQKKPGPSNLPPQPEKPLSTKWERREQRLQKMNQQLSEIKKGLNRLHQTAEREFQSRMPGFQPSKRPTLNDLRYGVVSD